MKKEGKKFYNLDIQEVFNELQSSGGLSGEEAKRRLEERGFNELPNASKVSAWQLLLEQFKNILILILLAAAIFSIFLGHAIESVAIIVIILFAVLLGFIQEYRAEKSLESLRKMAAPTATALRDGEETELPARELVVGDVIILKEGDRIPADGRVVESFNLKVEEAALTGESLPIEKKTEPIKGELTIGDRKNMVFSGTTLIYGRGRAIVTATGLDTEFGEIAKMLQAVENKKTPLQENLDKIGRTLAKAAGVIVFLIVILGLLRGQNFVEMLIFGIALAVAVVPEALPAVVTISLAIGVQKMVKKNALIRNLSAVETLGGTSVICSDKTGTITRGEMTARKIFVSNNLLEISGIGYEPKGEFSKEGQAFSLNYDLLELLKAGALSSDARLVESENTWQIKGDPTEGALVVAAAKAGLKKASLEENYPRLAEVPFSSETKRMTTLHQDNNEKMAYVKGAPEIVLEACSKILNEEKEEKLDSSQRRKISEVAQKMAEEALRVLAIARKKTSNIKEAEDELTFVGLIGMIDPPRPEVKRAIATCMTAGIKPVIITGDHPLTASAIAKELGLLKKGKVVTGADLEKMNSDDLAKIIDETDIYARVSPEHKLKIVEAFQAKGRTVAMTGDGVNDAPALKKSDIGVAMSITGTDVSKEASDMLLLDDNFTSIVSAVEEGRAIFGNIKKYLTYLLSSNIGEIGLMTGASILGLPLPLSATQILYINLATDGLPALALAVDPPEDDLMNKKPRPRSEGVFTKKSIILMLAGGFWSSLINISVFAWAKNSCYSINEAMTMTFVCLVLVEFFKAYSFRSEKTIFTKNFFSNKWLNLAVIWELFLLLLLIYTPTLREIFGLFPLNTRDWLIVSISAFSIIPFMEIAKKLSKRMGNKKTKNKSDQKILDKK